MKNTRLMELLFSNTDEEIAAQVDKDIKTADAGVPVDTEELKYEKTADGVAITDKENGEVTLAQKSDEANTYDLVAVPDDQLEKFLHPSADGHKGSQVGAADEDAQAHLDPALQQEMGLPTNAGEEQTVEENAEKEFSIVSDNTAWQKIFSYPQEFADKLFSEVIESEETAKVGDLKIEKIEGEDAVVVTDETTGDQAKVTMDEDNMEVEELDSKNFSEEESFMPLFVIGVQPYDHVIVDAQAYSDEAAEELVNRLTEDGVEAVQVFESQDEARDYAISLLEGLGANPGVGQVDEPELQKEYSDAAIYTCNYRTNDTVFTSRLFSESALGVTESRDAVEEALGEGEAVEIDGAVVTPIEAQSAIIEDNGEYTLATIQGEDLRLETLDPEEAEGILGEGILNERAEEDENECEECEEKTYSDYSETRFFSENEEMTDYMVRLFSEECDQNEIESAIETGEEIENDTEIITPISNSAAVVEDKESGEFTKVSIIDEDTLNVHPISEDEAENLTADLVVEDTDEDLDEEEKVYSDITETRYFSENEYMNDYMIRLFSDEAEADEEEIVDAIEKGEEIENDEEVVTPIDATTAVIEDKESGEYTKATLDGEEGVNVEAIDEDEAHDLLEDIATGEEKDFSWYCDETETRFFCAAEDVTSYMERIYSEEADEEEVADAIESGEEIENDTEIITPVDAKTAVVEDKETGEYTKAVLKGDEEVEFDAISEDEANDLLEDIEVEEDGQKEFSSPLEKFFDEVAAAPVAAPAQGTVVPVAAPAQGAAPAEVAPSEEEPAHTVEEVEDKALAAVASIQAAAQEAQAAIMEAKAAPAPTAEPEIQEAQFSGFDVDENLIERTFSQNQEDTLISWLQYK